MKENYRERIDKILSASAGLSRKDARVALRRGRVTVNGVVQNDGAEKITQDDELCLDGNKITYTRFIYVLLNKPVGYVCSTDERDGIPVMELFGNLFGGRDAAPVGRLDKNTTGALLITDDGVLAHLLLAPAKHIKKTYICGTEFPIENSYISSFANGVDIGEDKPTLPAELEILSEKKAALTITEGKFHQVKRMFTAVGNKIVNLHRFSFAGLEIPEDSPAGIWRRLSDAEIERLFVFTGKNLQ